MLHLYAHAPNNLTVGHEHEKFITYIFVLMCTAFCIYNVYAVYVHCVYPIMPDINCVIRAHLVGLLWMVKM